MRKRICLLTILLFTSILFASSANVFAETTTQEVSPPAPTLSYFPMTPTNGNVTVTIYYSKTAAVKQYKLGLGGVWTTYTAPVAVTSNTHVYARYQDTSGLWSSLGGYMISNIDKTPPTNPVLTLSTTAPTNQKVSVAISFSADSTVKQYRIGSSTAWSDYTTPIVLYSNNTICARASDSVGNWTPTASCPVTNIDCIPPDSPTFAVSNSSVTNKDVSVTINYSSDSAIRKFKLGSSGNWTDYTAPIVVSSNNTIFAKASDSAGNWTGEASFKISNIDKTPPSKPILTASPTVPTNQSVTMNIIYSSDSSIKQYKIGMDGTWMNYTAPVMLNSNNIIYARASDYAGNWTAEASDAIDNIDVTPPVKPTFSASTTSPTDQAVNVTLNYSQDSSTKQYRIGMNSSWTNYTAPVTLTSNAVIYARSSDNAGNWSLEASYTVSNITKMILGYTMKNSSADKASYNSIVANTSALNEIATVTYSVDGNGNVNGAAPAEQINYSNTNGIRTKLMIYNNYDSKIAQQLLESPANRQNLINNLLYQMKTNNYKGVDMDIENIPAADRDCYTALMRDIYSTMKPLGYGVSVAVPGKTIDSPNWFWNYAFDYKALAEYSDFLMLMTYDEHYPGGTPGSIASIGWVTNVVNYALTVVPKEKLVLGIPAYGYDWVGKTTTACSINECYGLASQYGATINFDSTVKSKYFTYTTNGVAHTVWFEDGETISYKLDLVNSKDLKGIGIWRLGLENTGYWTSIRTKLGK